MQLPPEKSLRTEHAGKRPQKVNQRFAKKSPYQLGGGRFGFDRMVISVRRLQKTNLLCRVNGVFSSLINCG
jgi:hypothetical protein